MFNEYELSNKSIENNKILSFITNAGRDFVKYVLVK